MKMKKIIVQSRNVAFLAQMVERWPFKPMAVGSIPTEGVFFLFIFLPTIFHSLFSPKSCYIVVKAPCPRG